MIFSENRCPPRIECGAGFFGIMLYSTCIPVALMAAMAVGLAICSLTNLSGKIPLGRLSADSVLFRHAC
jgi:hypothetical protein